MSRATTVVDSKQRAVTAGDRRDAAAPRMQYEALVEVGAGSLGGFEAESIDVSPEGIRLRTAYLPDTGERLVCRFDGFGGEIVADGEVIWRHEQGRGGEFGVRFVGLDERGAHLLESMCQRRQQGDPATDSSEPNAFIGSRVKLHIQGLGSPMRARIKDTAKGEVLVGSSLEFLRVGRDVELEDVEQGGRRLALIEHVGVEIEPENNIPQLVVALRYEGANHGDAPESLEDHATSPTRQKRKQAPVAAKTTKETTPEPTVIDSDESMGREALPPTAAVAARVTETDEDELSHPPRTLATPVPVVSHDDQPVAVASGRLRDAGTKIGALARRLGPKLVAAGSNAKTALGSVLAAVKSKREARKLERAATAPKRTTAPPPSGALRSDGRRLFRQQSDESVDADLCEVEAPKPDYKRRAVMASVVGALAVVAIYVGASQLSRSRSSEPLAAASLAQDTEQVPAAAAEAPAPGGAVATADVPLFGATPLSTTEAVPTPPNPEALALDGENPEAASDTPTKETADGGQLRKEWGVGHVADPVTLKLTMDGDVAGFTGAEGATGFTLVVPGRKSASSAAGLARKDNRIESVNVVNYPDRAEVTVQFKGDAPAYQARADGNRLLIDIEGKKAKRGEADDGDEPTPKKKKGKTSQSDGQKASKSDGHEKSKSAEKSKKHGNGKGDRAESSAAAGAKSDAKKSDVKSSDPRQAKADGKKSDKKSDAKKGDPKSAAAGDRKVDAKKAKK